MPLLLGKMAACPSSGKLEQQRGSTISFHHSPLELPSIRNKKKVSINQVNIQLSTTKRSCLCPCRHGRWQISVGGHSTICPHCGSSCRLRSRRFKPLIILTALPERLNDSVGHLGGPCVKAAAIWETISRLCSLCIIDNVMTFS